MPLFCLGLNHQTAPVEIRERLAIRDSELDGVVQALRAHPGVEEAVVLSTCNRVEIYGSADTAERAFEFLNGKFALDAEVTRDFYRHQQLPAARHLFRVVSGLDSMVLGETEIFGQVKAAYARAKEAGTTSRTLNKLFQQAFRVGKLVRTHTRIQQGATSVGAAAVELAEKIFGDLRDSQVMILGAGEISRRTAQSLQSRGAKSLIVANRTFDRAAELAQEMGGRAVHFDQWPEEILGVDVVISSTAAPHYVITPDHVKPALRKRHGRPLFLIDIAVPRDIDPAVNEFDGVYLYDIDALEQLAAEARSRREQEILNCESIIEAELKSIEPLLSPGAEPGRPPASPQPSTLH